MFLLVVPRQIFLHILVTYLRLQRILNLAIMMITSMIIMGDMSPHKNRNGRYRPQSKTTRLLLLTGNYLMAEL